MKDEHELSPGYKIGHNNREAVRTWFLSHVGCSARECAKAIGLSEVAVGRHLKTLRAEWLPKAKAKPRPDWPPVGRV